MEERFWTKENVAKLRLAVDEPQFKRRLKTDWEKTVRGMGFGQDKKAACKSKDRRLKRKVKVYRYAQVWQAKEIERFDKFSELFPEDYKRISQGVKTRAHADCEDFAKNREARTEKRNWTPEEDELLLNLYQTLGNKWVEIAESLPGRNRESCRSRYRLLSKKKTTLL